jgi:putative endonuclease
MLRREKLALRPGLGRQAEEIACTHLRALGFQIVARNVRLGRLELDVIAQQGRLLVFCEVRSRSHDRLMTPAQSIGRLKVLRVKRAAAQWLRQARLGRVQVRFDVASVLFDTPQGRLTYLVGAF